MNPPVLSPEGSADHFDADRLRRTVIAFRDAVKIHAPRINRLNVYPVPDGDTTPIRIPGSLKLALVITAVATLVLGILPGVAMHFGDIAQLTSAFGG